MQNRRHWIQILAWSNQYNSNDKRNIGCTKRKITYNSELYMSAMNIYAIIGNSISIQYYTSSNALFSAAQSEFSDLITDQDVDAHPDYRFRLVLYTSNKSLIAQFLELIDKYHNLSEIKHEIYLYLNILDQNQIASLVKTDQFASAFEMVKSVGDKSIYWLGQLCEAQGKPDKALDCYQAISKCSEDYKAASQAAADIMLQYRDASKNSDEKTKLPPAEDKRQKEFLLRFMWRAANPEYQPVVDRLCQELMNDHDLIPPITGVTVNEDTIINMINHNNSLQNKLLVREREIEQLKSALKLYSATNTNNPANQPASFLKRYTR